MKEWIGKTDGSFIYRFNNMMISTATITSNTHQYTPTPQHRHRARYASRFLLFICCCFVYTFFHSCSFCSLGISYEDFGFVVLLFSSSIFPQKRKSTSTSMTRWPDDVLDDDDRSKNKNEESTKKLNVIFINEKKGKKTKKNLKKI